MIRAGYLFAFALNLLTYAPRVRADYVISRLPSEVDYLVESCAAPPSRECGSARRIDQANLRALRGRVLRALWAQRTICVSTLCARDRESVTLGRLADLDRANAVLRALIRSRSGGLVRIPGASFAARIFARLLDRPMETSGEPSPVPRFGSPDEARIHRDRNLRVDRERIPAYQDILGDRTS